MDLEDLTPEQRERISKAKTQEELLALAKEAGFKLSDKELSSISGGGWGDTCWSK